MVTTLVFDNCCCNGLDYLDLSRCASVRRVEVGDHCFRGVEEVKLVGLRELESVVIGKDCFVQDIGGKDPNRRFCLKSCPSLKELKMGRFSFSDYSVIEIENVDALEVIEIGDLNEKSYNFYSASLELKSILIHKE